MKTLNEVITELSTRVDELKLDFISHQSPDDGTEDYLEGLIDAYSIALTALRAIEQGAN